MGSDGRPEFRHLIDLRIRHSARRTIWVQVSVPFRFVLFRCVEFASSLRARNHGFCPFNCRPVFKGLADSLPSVGRGDGEEEEGKCRRATSRVAEPSRCEPAASHSRIVLQA